MDRWTMKRAADESSDASSSSSSTSSGFSYKNFQPRKKPAPRRADPGRRYRSGRVYDSALGITCHFCRQKTTTKHVICCGRTCVLAFCRNCLQNRHGEDISVETADEDYSWLCPKCRGGCGPGCKNCCNCTFCRKEQNLRPPKIPNSEMQARGFDNVHDYLIHLETGESPESISARKLGKGWCRTYGKSVPKSHQNSEVHEQRETDINKVTDEVIETQKCTNRFHDQRNRDTNKVSDEVASSMVHEQSERNMSKGEDAIKENDVHGTRHKQPFPSQFSSRNDFKEKLKARLIKPFSSQELSELWDAIRCRRPLCQVTEMPQETRSFPTNELGSSYIKNQPDLARKLTATIDKEEKLRLLRGFFFWLEHASMPGSFKPWLENDKDEECFELAGPDFQVLGVLVDLDKHQDGENQEDMKPKKIKQDVKEISSSQAKVIFNWDEEDVKPTIKEKKWTNFSCINAQAHVKEEPGIS